MIIKTKENNLNSGFIIPALLMAIVIFGIMMLSVGNVVNFTLGSATRNESSQKALSIAESGINYYLWHLNHNKDDYKDGNASATFDADLGYGPFIHDYFDGNGKKTGKYTIYVKPGVNGSTVSTVRSIGSVSSSGGNINRTVQARIGNPSFSIYSVVSNSQLWFGDTETADGLVHSNVGVKMDGQSNGDVTSSNSTYVPTNSGNGSGTTKPGVWCDSTVTAPVNCYSRSKDSWRYPVASVDFNGITASLCDLKKKATNDFSSNSCTKDPSRTPSYVPSNSTSNSYSETRGYYIKLDSSNTYDLYKVANERDSRANINQILSPQLVQSNITIPANGVIYVEDNVWIETSSGGFDGRITIASARLSKSGDTTITITNNLEYADPYEGGDSIGLIAEDNIDIAPYVPNNLTVHGALIAQKGRVQYRSYYRETGDKAPGYTGTTQRLEFYGSIASEEQWTWSWIFGYTGCSTTSTNANCWAGFKNNSTIYDENLRYAPPPSFPTTSTFDILEWREVQQNP